MHLRLELQLLTLAFLSRLLWSEYIVFLLVENGDLCHKITWIFRKIVVLLILMVSRALILDL